MNSGENTISISVGETVRNAEIKLIEATLDSCFGDKKLAAEKLGISLKTLYNRINDHKIKGYDPLVSAGVVSASQVGDGEFQIIINVSVKKGPTS